MVSKPFTFGVAATGDNFTDRIKETERLLMNFENGINTILISPRRWGKTSLIRKVGKLAASDSLKIVYIDVFSCRSERDFYDAFASAVLKQTSSKWEEWVENTRLFLSRISPKISLGANPMTDFSISLDLNPKNEGAEDILKLPELIAKKKGVRIVVCIDEFQQITEFKNSKSFQKKLRGIWQLQESVSYCLFGSRKHLMNELFESRSFPFYKFGDTMNLQKIPTGNWIEYICSRFEATGKEISPELAEKISLRVDNHSSYVQQLAWLVWIHTDTTASEGGLEAAWEDILDQNTPLFEKQTEDLTSYQLNLLRAIVDGINTGFSQKCIIDKYNLGSSANVSVIRQSLIKRELIEVANQFVDIPDPVMKAWLAKERI